MNIKLTKKALEERKLYKLEDNEAYFYAANEEIEQAFKRYKRYGYYINKDTATKNMLKALRMLPFQNTPEEWARLHVTEALIKL